MDRRDVLVIDDSPFVTTILRKPLEAMGIFVRSGETLEAFEIPPAPAQAQSPNDNADNQGVEPASSELSQ